MAEISEKNPMIFIKGATARNNHSEIDAIGSETCSIPMDIWMAMSNDPDWAWMFPSDSTKENEASATFRNLNPQFDPLYRAKYGKRPPLPVNKDGYMLKNVPGYPESHTPEFVKYLMNLKKRYNAGEIKI